MLDKVFTNNQVTIAGRVVGEFGYSHTVYGEDFYTVDIEVSRLSNSNDIIPVMVSERILDVRADYRGYVLRANGQFRSYNRHEETRNRLVLSVFAREVEIVEPEEEEQDPNHIFLDGYVCKKPVYRKTPLGREIADVLLAVNRPYGISGISAPADARNVVRFSIRPVDGDQKICDFSAKWGFPVHRRFAYVSVQENGIALHIFIVIFHKFHLSGKHREHQPVFLFLMAVVGAKLPHHMDILPFIILIHIHKTLRDHDRDPVLGIAKPFDQHIYHIKAFAEYLMAECKPGCDFSHDFHLIVFNNLICHDCSSPSSFLYFV